MPQFELVPSEQFEKNLAELDPEERREIIRLAEMLRTNPGIDVAHKTSVQSGERRYVVYTGWDLYVTYRHIGNTSLGLVSCGRHPARPGRRL